MLSASSPRPFLPRLLRSGLLAVAAGASLAGPAQAAPAAEPLSTLVFEMQDPAGDASGTEEGNVDILSASVTQDRAAGAVRATITFAEDPSTAAGWIHVSLGFTMRRKCVTDVDVGGVMHLHSDARAPEAKYMVTAPQILGGPAMKISDGRVVRLETDDNPALLSTSVWNCARVEMVKLTAEGKADPWYPYDDVVAFAKETPVPPTLVAPVPVNGTPVVLDADRDAVPDSTDQCVTVPGAGTDGCPATTDAASLRLGAKRLAVDRLLPLTGKACPAAVKASVSVRGRVIGRKRLGVVGHGSFCRVVGKVSLKKRAKKVRVVITGTGVTSLRTVVKS